MKKGYLLATFVVIIAITALSMFNASTVEQEFTRKDAVKMIVSMVKKYQNYNLGAEGFSDINDSDVTYAKELNMIYGNNNMFYPDNIFSQQDFLLVLKRAIDRAAPDLFYNNANIKHYGGKYEVSEYAKYSLNYLTAIDVITEYDVISPSANITVGDAYKFIERAEYAIRFGAKSMPGLMPVSKQPRALIYHSIEIPEGRPEDQLYLYVTPNSFEEQVKYLSDNGYTFLFPEELSYMDSIKKCVIITLDDGLLNNFENALPILEKYNAKATVFVNADTINQPWFCNRDQLISMNLKGVFRVYSHTKSHFNLTKLSVDEIEKEYSQNNDYIYNITKRDVNSLAYPFGEYNADVLHQARRYYKTAFSCGTYIRMDPHTIRRDYVEFGHDLPAFINVLNRK